MGVDICTYSKHNLDTSNVVTLAKDLFKRLPVNITYGYYSNKKHCELLGIKPTEEFVVLENLVNNPKLRTFVLYDEKYQQKLLYTTFGKDILTNPKYELSFYGNPTQQNVEKEINSFEYPQYLLEIEESQYHLVDHIQSMYIYKDFIENDMQYFSRWYYFRDFYDEQKYKVDFNTLKRLQSYRESLHYYTKKLGGTFCYFIDDAGNCCTQGVEYEVYWKDLKNLIEKNAGKQLTNIALLNIHKAPQKKQTIQKTPSLAFVDDFRDVKTI
ncbi:hypothetical protein [Wenyingzhuangia aestuarii]|uniref:hypothetical protein n=1 Tax=Wenyingzhuangia aestuarii TaxID=1647582 RepID=UPI001438DAE5|nr:hypothetical protein [Wenyingzhuangia aestuarii]NJB83141.1 hypothetical protein [Wenyingzhuangia aestuarii]